MRPYSPAKLPIDIDWNALVSLIGRANRSLAQFDEAIHSIPNPDSLLSPMTVQEAVLSSKIEGTQATLGDVYLLQAGDETMSASRKEDVHEITNYRAALEFAEEKLEARPFTLNLLRSLHSILLDSVRGRDKGRGEFRREQNWIGAPGSTMETADFVPPRWDVLSEYLDNWEKYYHSEDKDPFVQLGLLHAQFEILHPFLEGNGRLGRLIVPLFLYEKRLLRRPTFYISGYFETHRDEYVARLRNIGHGSKGWQTWIAFFLTAVIEQARENANKARQIIDLYKELKEQTLTLTHSRHAVPLLDEIFATPIFQPSQLRQRNPLLPSKQVLNTLLNRLKEAGMLKIRREASGRQPQVFALARLVNLCEGKEVI